ncbi:hypothetical protein F4604DRAFT_1920674 [Suillus subluteus]|nr:hypothetical protein F4604DRAFT_1920674 [Suillus subluteus]
MPRVPTGRVHHLRAKLTSTQKAERRSRQEALANAIDTAQSAYAEEAAHIAETHGRSLKWTHSQLFLRTRMLCQQQSVNSWNTFVRAKLNEANEDREQGDRIKLTRFIAENKDKLTCAHALLSSAKKRVYNTQVLEACKKKNQVAQANPKAILHDINATFTSMDRKAQGFYVAICSNIEDLSEPKMFFTEKAKKFVKEVLDVEPRHLGLKLESYIVSGLHAHAASHRQRPLNKLVSGCRTFIQEGLNSIALEKDIGHRVNMNYTNYEHNIIEHCGVALVNWPLSGPVCNLSKAGGRAKLIKLSDALESNTCRWVILTDEEHATRMKENRICQAQGELIYVARK